MKIIKPGDMKRSCMYCGAEVELSIEDIKTKLDVVRYWVCPCCGREIHNV